MGHTPAHCQGTPPSPPGLGHRATTWTKALYIIICKQLRAPAVRRALTPDKHCALKGVQGRGAGSFGAVGQSVCSSPCRCRDPGAEAGRQAASPGLRTDPREPSGLMCAVLHTGAGYWARGDVRQLPDPCGMGPVQPGELQEELLKVKAWQGHFWARRKAALNSFPT